MSMPGVGLVMDGGEEERSVFKGNGSKSMKGNKGSEGLVVCDGVGVSCLEKGKFSFRNRTVQLVKILWALRS